MNEERNKATERLIVAEALNRGNLTILAEHLTKEFTYHGPGGAETRVADEYIRFLNGLRAAYPDIHVDILNILAERDLVATRTLCTFTYALQRAGDSSPTRRRVSISGSILDRFEDDKLAETWEHYDRLELYQQMGLMPARPPAD